jgi:hypothetical protein
MESADLVIVAISPMVMMNCGSCRLEKIVALFVAPPPVKERARSVQGIEAR